MQSVGGDVAWRAASEKKHIHWETTGGKDIKEASGTGRVEITIEERSSSDEAADTEEGARSQCRAGFLPIDFSDEDASEASSSRHELSVFHGRHSPVSSVVSMKSSQSMDLPLRIALEPQATCSVVHGRHSPVSSAVSLKSSQSMEPPLTIEEEQQTQCRSQTAESAAVLCGVCPKTACKSCLTCMASYCGDHVKPHYTAPALQRHRLVEATEDLEQRLCQRHSRELELFCITDQTAICALCGVKKHRLHNITDLGKRQEKQIKGQDVKHTSDAHPAVTDLCVKSVIPAPENLSCVEVDLTSVLVSWSEPAGVDQVTYLLMLCQDGICLRVTGVSSLQHSFCGLDIGREYTMSVSTTLQDGHSSPVYTVFTTPFPVPEGVTVGSVSPTSADLSWSLQQGMQQIPHKFLLYYCCKGTEPQIISTETCSATLTGLQPDTRYAASVYCQLEDGRIGEATLVVIDTGSVAPKDLSVAVDRAESGDQWKADLSWSLEQGMEQGPHKFLISYFSERTDPQTISTESCSATLTDLHPDTQYTASICSETQRGDKTETVSTTFHTSEWRMVLLGKSGDGKSSTGNTILGEEVFEVQQSPFAGTKQCQSCSRTVNGRKITLIDTPGFLDPEEDDSNLKDERGKCLTLCSPGPHAFIIVLQVARMTTGKIEVIKQTVELFKSKAFKHAVIVFTHGEQLNVWGQTIQKFVAGRRSQAKPSQRENVKRKTPLMDLIDKCEGRFHVIDNYYWKEKQEGEYSNRGQIEKLFDTIEKMVQKNGVGYYTWEDQDTIATGTLTINTEEMFLKEFLSESV